MKKLITLVFAAAFVTAASAQSGYSRNDRAYNNSYQSSPYSNQYSRNSQWNDRGDQNRYERRRWAERQRYEMMMRRRAHYYDRRYYRYPSYGYSARPSFRLSIGISGRR